MYIFWSMKWNRKGREKYFWAFCFLNFAEEGEGMPPPTSMKILAFLISQRVQLYNCQISASNLFFLIVQGANFDKAVLPLSMLRVSRAQWTFKQKACPFTCQPMLCKLMFYEQNNTFWVFTTLDTDQFL